YRRLVSSKLNLPLCRELEFTTKRIDANFSNYSAWHYRSALLPKLYPPTVPDQVLEEKTLFKEFDLVINAAFTDASDQSAWFYHRWLLGRSERSLSVVQALCSKDTGKLFLQFSKPLKSLEGVCVYAGDEKVDCLS